LILSNKIYILVNTGIAWLSSVRVEKREVKSYLTNVTHDLFI